MRGGCTGGSQRKCNRDRRQFSSDQQPVAGRKSVCHLKGTIKNGSWTWKSLKKKLEILFDMFHMNIDIHIVRLAAEPHGTV